MYANDPSDVHLSDENTVRTVDKQLHEDREDFQHSRKDRMRQTMVVVVEQLDCSHLSLDSVFSISFDDFETIFLPE